MSARPRTCHASHGDDDPLLGQPLCGDCYDYASHVIWQWWAPDLWRRFTITLRRLVAKTLDVPASRLGAVATVQYAKVAEYQLRGVIHFHALVRLDGPKTPDGFAPAPHTVNASVLADLVRQAVASVRLTVPGVDEDETTLVIGHWTCAGTGWATEGDRILAVEAAARAREHDRWKAEQRKQKTHNSGEGTVR